MKCYICQCEVCIPVIVKCFPCFQVNKIHCNTFTRFCFECMVRFLQLHQSCGSRSETIKCLTCDEVVHPRTLNYKNSFEYDFFLQQMQISSRQQCPYCFLEYDGIFSHLEECPSSFVQCECGYVTIRELFNYHVYHCSEYISCNSCNEYILLENYCSHLEEKHEETFCLKCKQIVDIHHLSIHKNFLCKFRLIRCRFCKETFEFHNLNEHLEEHKQELQDVVESLKTLLKKMYEKYHEITREQNIYFERFFLTG